VQSRGLRTAWVNALYILTGRKVDQYIEGIVWVPYGNMETLTPHSSETSQVIMMKLCKFDCVGKANTFAKFGWNPPARGRSMHT